MLTLRQPQSQPHAHNIHTYKYTRMYIHKIFEAVQYNLYMSTPISKTSSLDRNLATKVKEKMNRRERRPRQFNFLYLNKQMKGYHLKNR